MLRVMDYILHCMRCAQPRDIVCPAGHVQENETDATVCFREIESHQNIVGHINRVREALPFQQKQFGLFKIIVAIC